MSLGNRTASNLFALVDLSISIPISISISPLSLYCVSISLSLRYLSGEKQSLARTFEPTVGPPWVVFAENFFNMFPRGA